MKFSVGEIVIHAYGNNPKLSHLLGQEAEILSIDDSPWPYQLDLIAPDGKPIWVKEECLRKKKGNPKDTDTVVSWDDCIWQPERIYEN